MSQLKYFQSWFSEYENADFLQTLSLILFVIFFLSIAFFVFSKPKTYYKEASELPLDNDEITNFNK